MMNDSELIAAIIKRALQYVDGAITVDELGTTIVELLLKERRGAFNN